MIIDEKYSENCNAKINIIEFKTPNHPISALIRRTIGNTIKITQSIVITIDDGKIKYGNISDLFYVDRPFLKQALKAFHNFYPGIYKILFFTSVKEYEIFDKLGFKTYLDLHKSNSINNLIFRKELNMDDINE